MDQIEELSKKEGITLSEASRKLGIPSHFIYNIRAVAKKKAIGMKARERFTVRDQIIAAVKQEPLRAAHAPKITNYILEEDEDKTPDGDDPVSIVIMKGKASSVERIARSLSGLLGNGVHNG